MFNKNEKEFTVIIKFEPNRYKHEQLQKAYEIVISASAEQSAIAPKKQAEECAC